MRAPPLWEKPPDSGTADFWCADATRPLYCAPVRRVD
jgi:hypothetical protein